MSYCPCGCNQCNNCFCCYPQGYNYYYNQNYNPFCSSQENELRQEYMPYSQGMNIPRPMQYEIGFNNNPCQCEEHKSNFENNSQYNEQYNKQYNDEIQKDNIGKDSNNNEKVNSSNENKNNTINENKKSNYELSVEYENQIRQEIEKTTPLISEQLDIKVLIDDYKQNEEYSNSIKIITDKYHLIRKVRRDGNCFYRSFIYRLFEFICMKNNKELFEKVKKKIEDAKELTQNNGYDWMVVEDFYNNFLNEFVKCFNSLSYDMTVRDYLDALFKDQEKGNYLIYFIRFCIAAYLKENHFLYDVYVEGPFDKWIQSEVEAIDHEADQIQIMACVNYFDIGVKIEYLNPQNNEVVKFPEDLPEEKIFINVLFTPGHYDILYP